MEFIYCKYRDITKNYPNMALCKIKQSGTWRRSLMPSTNGRAEQEEETLFFFLERTQTMKSHGTSFSTAPSNFLFLSKSFYLPLGDLHVACQGCQSLTASLWSQINPSFRNIFGSLFILVNSFQACQQGNKGDMISDLGGDMGKWSFWRQLLLSSVRENFYLHLYMNDSIYI